MCIIPAGTQMKDLYEENIARLANDLFNKRQRLLKAGQCNINVVDRQTAEALETEYRIAEHEYHEA
jgi:RecB family endonuclease NucS